MLKCKPFLQSKAKYGSSSDNYSNLNFTLSLYYFQILSETSDIHEDHTCQPLFLFKNPSVIPVLGQITRKPHTSTMSLCT